MHSAEWIPLKQYKSAINPEDCRPKSTTPSTHSSEMYQSAQSLLLDEQKVKNSKETSNGVRSTRGKLVRSEGFDLGSRQMTSVSPFVPGGTNDVANADAEANNKENKFIHCKRSEKCMYFPNEPTKRIDYVLVYSCSDEITHKESDDKAVPDEADGTRHQGKVKKREQFENNLRELGLELSECQSEEFPDLKFVLIHAPFKLLLKQAETLSLKMPLVQSDVDKERDNIEGFVDRFLRKFTIFTFDAETNERLKEPNYFTAPFVAAQRKCYVNSDNEDKFFDGSDRSRMVYDLLIRTRYDDDKENLHRIGIRRLLDNGTYTDAYPIHEECGEDGYDVKKNSNREVLYYKWARWTNFYKYQPLSLIKRYFGTKIGIYFAWLGYYTKCLIPVALLGCFCFLYGVFTYSQDIPSNDICGSDGVGAKIIMCPSCHLYCDYTQLNSSCTYAKLVASTVLILFPLIVYIERLTKVKFIICCYNYIVLCRISISYMFDNYGTVFFTAVMSICATLFLEGWKRYHCELAWKWGLLDFEVDEENVRPEYQVKVKAWRKKRKNLITKTDEPVMPFRSKIFRFFGSGVAVLFCLLLVLAFVVGVIIYRLVIIQLLYRQDNLQNYASLVTFSTAAMINLTVILLMGRVYTSIARKLTEWECPRTQADYDSSYTFKVFWFQVINYYSSIIYIAFIKGKISSVPGRTILGLHLEECDPAGCMVELVIQLGIIMVGKQLFSSFVEIMLPVITIYYRKIIRMKFQKQSHIQREKEEEATRKRQERYEADYTLNPTYDQFLFDEYLEMVIQFGFVTLFVSAFPLAPICALINNILEIRLDAYKFTISSRKPVPERAKDIGIWLPILDGISKCAVLMNALIIAFTSDFIPKLVYLWRYDHDDLQGYVNSSLSYFDASSLEVKWSDFAGQNITECRFRDYRRIPCSLYPVSDCGNDYSRTEEGWVVLVFRLAFVLAFQVLVSTVKGFCSYIIPDVPSRIFVQLQRQKYLSRQARLSNMNKAEATCNYPFYSVDSDRVITRKSDGSGNSGFGDREEVAFQPGDFDGNGK